MARTRKIWTEEEIAIVRGTYPDTATAEIAASLGRTVSSVYGMAAKLGLHKGEAFCKSPLSGRFEKYHQSDRAKANRFQKGQTPWNKGIKGSSGTHPNSRRTQFKKGVRRGVAVKLYKPIGTERITRDGYLERKINDDMPLQKRWKGVHRIVWEQHNGPIPDGINIIFRDGNKQNCDIANLQAATDAEIMSKNTFHNYPEPVKRQIHILAGFKRRLNNAKKQNRRSA